MPNLQVTYNWRLLNYGIENFTNIKYAEKGETLGFYPLQEGGDKGVWAVGGGNGIYTVAKDQMPNLQVTYNWRRQAEPIRQGDILGTAVLSGGGRDLQYVNLIAETDGDYGRLYLLWHKLTDGIKRIFVG